MAVLYRYYPLTLNKHFIQALFYYLWCYCCYCCFYDSFFLEITFFMKCKTYIWLFIYNVAIFLFCFRYKILMSEIDVTYLLTLFDFIWVILLYFFLRLYTLLCCKIYFFYNFLPIYLLKGSSKTTHRCWFFFSIKNWKMRNFFNENWD